MEILEGFLSVFRGLGIFRVICQGFLRAFLEVQQVSVGLRVYFSRSAMRADGFQGRSKGV